jgi:hypothetical protein
VWLPEAVPFSLLAYMASMHSSSSCSLSRACILAMGRGLERLWEDVCPCWKPFSIGKTWVERGVEGSKRPEMPSELKV